MTSLRWVSCQAWRLRGCSCSRHAAPCPRFVFCDNGTKKHPKIYGFSSLEAAARAFDILTCKRALEKGRTVAGIISAGQVCRCVDPLPPDPRTAERMDSLRGARLRRLPPQLGSLRSTRQPSRVHQPSLALAARSPTTQSLGTNHPASDYANRELLAFLESASRDDCIYGLKQCAKKGHALAPG